jgi:hypothetical protein
MGATMGATTCDSCGVKNVSTATRLRSANEDWHVLAGCARVSCSEFAEPAYAQPRGVKQRVERSGVDGRAPAENGTTRAAAIHFQAGRQNISSFREVFPEYSSYQPLSVSLKI